MTKPADAQPPEAGEEISGVLFIDNSETGLSAAEEARNSAEEETASWETRTKGSELRKSLASMAKVIQSEVLSRDHEDEAEGLQVDDGSRETGGHNLGCPVLIPGLPVELATKILARVPWEDQPKLLAVCKAWAACIISNSIWSVRLRDGLLESLFFTLSVPITVGSLRLSLFGFRVGPLEFDKPLASYDFLGRWSGFLRGFRCAVVGPDLFIVGGTHDGLHYATGKSVWRFNLISRKWFEAAAMHHARRDFACAVIKGRIYVAGGTSSSHVVPQGQGVATAVQSAEMYDPEEGKWRLLPSLHTARVGCLGVAFHDRFYVIGGGSDHGTVRFDLFRSAEVFDPNTSEWQTIDDMWQSGVQLPRAVAGYNSSLFAVDSDDQKLKFYDESCNTWRDVMNMPFSAMTDLPGKIRNEHAGRQQAMGGLPGDHLIQVPCQGLLWVGPCGFLSRASSLLRLEKNEGRGWTGSVGASSGEKEVSRVQKNRKDSKAYVIAAAGAISV